MNVATLLGLPDIPSPANDTLILDVLDKSSDVETLIADMCEYGEVKEASVCKGRRFGKFTKVQVAEMYSLDGSMLFVSLCTWFTYPLVVRNPTNHRYLPICITGRPLACSGGG